MATHDSNMVTYIHTNTVHIGGRNLFGVDNVGEEHAHHLVAVI